MGTDIHSYMETRDSQGRWGHIETPFPNEQHPEDRAGPFSTRSYDLFGFLAGIENDAHSPVIAEPRGLPDDLSPELRAEFGGPGFYHTPSWLTLAELLAHDYDQTFCDRNDGGGVRRSLREFLGRWYFDRLGQMQTLGAPESVRVVFWFDS